MLSFKLKKATHDRVAEVSLWLCLGGWIAGNLFLGYAGVSTYLEARSILKNHVVVPAALEFVDVSETYRRRTGTRLTYHFQYSFDIDGEAFRGEFSASESYVDDYMGKDTIDVAFSTTNRKFDRVSRLERNDSFLGLIGRMVVVAIISLLLTFAAFAYLTAGLFVVRPEDQHLVDAEDDDAEVPAKA